MKMRQRRKQFRIGEYTITRVKRVTLAAKGYELCEKYGISKRSMDWFMRQGYKVSYMMTGFCRNITNKVK